MMFSDTVTLYNHQSGDTWVRTVIYNTMWKKQAVSSVSSGKVSIGRQITVTIPADLYKADKKHVKPEVYTDPATEFTLREGVRDYIAHGETPEITDDFDIDTLLQRYEVGAVQVVADNTARPRLRHWRVTAV